jgi:hypothetical protein
MKKVEMVSQFRPPTRQVKKPKPRELPRVFDQQTRVEEIYWDYGASGGWLSGQCWVKPVIRHPYTRLPIIHPGMNRKFAV